MKSGPALHKLAKHRIEMLQQALNRADSTLAEARARASKMDKTLDDERALATQTGVGADFARYALMVRPKRDALSREIAQAAAHAAAVRSDLMDAFAEGKKIEILMERALIRERAEESRVEQSQLDEMALRKKA
ncbi:MAG: flagellar FliJ family protein [Caulobacterales bacterium]